MIRRNVLDRLMRVPNLRHLFEKTFRERVLSLTLRESELFKSLAPETFAKVIDFLQPRISFVRVSPGQPLFLPGRHRERDVLRPAGTRPHRPAPVRG